MSKLIFFLSFMELGKRSLFFLVMLSTRCFTDMFLRHLREILLKFSDMRKKKKLIAISWQRIFPYTVYSKELLNKKKITTVVPHLLYFRHHSPWEISRSSLKRNSIWKTLILKSSNSCWTRNSQWTSKSTSKNELIAETGV